ncbi:hypothetical protein AR686_00830 [Chryseobacterium aquaticum subsp. greenlandense]|uniref:Uncharacterized protein n=1 Tax=Chryseobacterium aquaticum subsp. greenlandense TaxID=345663 RepID=A0A101CJF9_9FLAO|nr:hypothetical protein AR686_00830 [Chryseobacterium aquaticum subsp. greenlandense]
MQYKRWNISHESHRSAHIFKKKIKSNTKKFMPFSKFIRENLRNLWEFIIWFKTKKTAEAAFKKLI